MSNKKRPYGVDLYELVTSLSQEEKQQFRKFVSRGASGKNPLFMALYDAMAGQRKYQEEKLILQVFQGKGSRFKSTCRYLTQVMLESLAHFRDKGGPKEGLIHVSIDRGFLDVARKTLQSEFEVAWARFQMCYLQKLFGLATILERHYQLNIELPKGCPDRQKLSHLRRLDLDLEDRFTSVRQMLISDLVVEDAFLSETGHFLESQSPETLPVPVLVKLFRLRSLYYFAKGNRALEWEDQMRVLSLIQTHDHLFRKETQIQELSRTITFYIRRSDFDGANRLLFELGMFPSESRAMDRVILKEWITKALYISSLVGQYSIGNKARKELERNENLFAPYMRNFLYHLASLNELRHEKWEGVNELQAKVSYSRSDRFASFWWGKPLLQVLARIEMGDVSGAKTVLRRNHDKFETCPQQYPIQLANLFATYLDSMEKGGKPVLLLSGFQHTIQNLLKDSSEFEHVKFFNILPWITSKLSGERIEVILDSEEDQFLISGIA